MTDTELTATEAAEVLNENLSSFETTADELRTLAEENVISARKRRGQWHFRPDVVARQIPQLDREEHGDDSGQMDRVDEAIQRGREQGRKESENARRSVFE